MDNKRKWVIRAMLIITSCAFVLYGAARGEIEIVWNKAVNICLECIGLG